MENKNTNTLNTIVNEFNRHGVNIVQLLESIDAIVSDSSKDFVTVQIQKDDGTTYAKKLPSIGKMMRDISSMQNLLSDLYDIKNNRVFVESDGIKHPIYVPSYPYEATPPNNLSEVYYIYKNNSFYTRLYLNNLENRLKCKRYIMSMSEDEFNNINIETETELTSFLTSNGYSYSIFEDYITKHSSEITYTGAFNITARTNNIYAFDNISYTNKINETFRLNINDILYFDNTEVRITAIDFDTNNVTLETVKGYGSITIGKTLRLLSPFTDKQYVDIQSNINDKAIIFLKNIDNILNVETLDYSVPIKIIVANLEVDPNSDINSIKSIVDFNTNLTDKNIPRILGLVPNAPVLKSTDFAVTQINDHLFNSTLVTNTKQKISRKNDITSEMSELDNAIDEKKSALNSQSSSRVSKVDTLTNDLNTLINKRKLKSNEYASIIKELDSINKDKLQNLKPKYRIRGFFEFPSELFSKVTGVQNIVQFITSYRYKGVNEETSQNKNFTRTDDNNNKKIGVFSDWIEVESIKRIRVYDEDTKKYFWEEQKTDDAQQININQIDIPIQKNESVEFKVRAVSEAGYPGEPVLSNWSNTVSINFPDELSASNDLSDIIQNTLNDEANLLIDTAFLNKGVDTHLADSKTVNEKYYSHAASGIASGIYDGSGNEYTLEVLLKKFQTEINSVEDRISSAVSELSYVLIDPAGNEITLTKNTLNKVFSGYYTDELASIDRADGDGVMITKEYQLLLYNNGGNSVFFRTPIEGGPANMDGTETYDSNTKRNYVDVPVLIDNTLSKQERGSFIYFRYMDYKLANDFYIDASDFESGASNTDANTIYLSDIDGTDNKYKQNTQASSQYDTFTSDGTTIGAYVLPSTIDDELYVGGADYGATRELKTGKENGIIIPIIFTYRLTDAVGELPGTLSNIVFSKKIGLDIFILQQNTISFDIEFTIKYDKDTYFSPDTNTPNLTR